MSRPDGTGEMDLTQLQTWIGGNPLLALGGVRLLSFIAFLSARGVIARLMVYIANRTETSSDDIIVEHLKPYRVAWLAPLAVIYLSAELAAQYQELIEKATLILILWVVAVTLSALIGATKEIYESRPSFTGVSIQRYLDLLRHLLIFVGIILSISLITDESPAALLTGMVAFLAIWILVFRDTIQSLVASVLISTNDLVTEGD